MTRARRKEQRQSARPGCHAPPPDGDHTTSRIPQVEDEHRRRRDVDSKYEGRLASATHKPEISNRVHDLCLHGTTARALARAGSTSGRRVDRDRLRGFAGPSTAAA